MKMKTILLFIILLLTGCNVKSPSIVSPSLSPTADQCPVEQIEQFLEVADSAEYRLAQIAQRADVTPSKDLEPVIK